MTPDFLRQFFPYQREWLQDPALYKIGMWARQTGKDYTCAAEAAFDCTQTRDCHWLIVACGERQAKESLLKAKEWACQLADQEKAGPPSCAKIQRESSTEILFDNGARITALPAKPATIRGYSANVILTEFAFHAAAEAVWQAIFPSVSNPLRGGAKKLRIISTPNGQGNMFHDLWLNSDIAAKHKVNIHQAVMQGLPLDPKTLKKGILDPESWAQEYECQFIDQSSVLLPYDLIEQCESADATEACSVDGLSAYKELFIGIDFGRKHDLTVCWVLERKGGELWTREVLTLQRSPTPAQLDALAPRVKRAHRTCLDYTGGGIGLGDSLVEQLGSDARLERCTFTSALKEEILVKLRAAFERRKIRIPSSREIRDDLHAIHRIVSPHGHITYRAAHAVDGHSDRCIALALALRAAESAPVSARASSVGSKFASMRR